MLKSFDGENDLEFAAQGWERHLSPYEKSILREKSRADLKYTTRVQRAGSGVETGMGTKKISNSNEM